MPRDILSRSRNGPQQQSQPALLPDKKGRQRLLEGGAALGKLDFHAHAAHAKAVGIDGPFHEPGQPLLPGEGAVKGHTAHVSQRIRAHRADVHAFHLFQLLCGQFHGKTSFAFLVGGETRKGSTPKSAALWPVLTLGQFVSNLFEMETPGPYVWPVKRQRVAARRSLVLCGGPKWQAASLSLTDCGRGAGRFPTRGGGVGRSSSRGRSHSAPAARLPAFTRGRPLFSCREEKSSSHIPPEKRSKWRGQSRIFLQIFFHAFQAAQNRLTDRAFVHALGLGNLPVGHAEDKVSVHPPALGFRQTVQRVPQTAEPLLELQNLVRGELVQAGGILDAVIRIQGIVRLVVADTLGIGRLIADAGPERLGHIVSNLNIFVLGVPVIKVAQIDNSHGMYLHIVFCGWVAGKRYGGRRGATPGGAAPHLGTVCPEVEPTRNDNARTALYCAGA